jgi:hypothetical protein
MAMILASKMTILGLETNTSGTFSLRDRKNSLARPQLKRPQLTTINNYRITTITSCR